MIYTPKTYSTGRYGVVDLYYRHIWINCHDEKIAHEIQQAFWSKATSVVFDLAWFDNYSEQAVDNSVSLNWKIPVCDDLTSHMLKVSVRNPVLSKTHTEYYSKLLINEPNHSNLTEDQQKELQNQMLFLMSVFECTKLHVEHNNAQQKSMLAQLRSIFSTEIRTPDIYDAVVAMAESHIESPNDPAIRLLKFLGKMYA
ncbi:hypothetical protein UFOVP328_162 [uncultured Caudovirales phage]|uniref:Uncharacterized protein n=1 Tax=uncultured Caudovirales phage TaxID=2100421 RepID=A0A6J5M1S9_9CAUD|nr:hypothetical protein UFOVP328_162 [uncultured Caudovirales phage]